MTHFHFCFSLCVPSTTHDEYPGVPTPLGTVLPHAQENIQTPAQLGILQRLRTCCFFELLDGVSGLNWESPHTADTQSCNTLRNEASLAGLLCNDWSGHCPTNMLKQHPDSGATQSRSATWALSPRTKGVGPFSSPRPHQFGELRRSLNRS